eukprot:2847612-Pleurochrysis_carterae.AAC.1
MDAKTSPDLRSPLLSSRGMLTRQSIGNSDTVTAADIVGAPAESALMFSAPSTLPTSSVALATKAEVSLLKFGSSTDGASSTLLTLSLPTDTLAGGSDTTPRMPLSFTPVCFPEMQAHATEICTAHSSAFRVCTLYVSGYRKQSCSKAMGYTVEYACTTYTTA